MVNIAHQDASWTALTRYTVHPPILLISGPRFWGSHNQNWSLCGTGRFQSPIDIDPDRLIYDPNLTPLKYDETMVE